ncbi:SymE family type I addiction module toxin [Xanthomonas citri]|uniref:SymE family type I addiction module toxin n=1 Tax=Xanthomonas citri TaxID=346 RepID=UPI001F1638E5|nr:SymE family type I addiction module toxin [Xanthomonas citri]
MCESSKSAWLVRQGEVCHASITSRPTPERSPSPHRSRQTTPPWPPACPQHCTVGYGYYPDSHQRIATLRLRGRWLEQLGFTIDSKLNIRTRNGELMVTVADDGEKATDKASNN